MTLDELFYKDQQLIDEALGKLGTLAAMGVAGLTGLASVGMSTPSNLGGAQNMHVPPPVAYGSPNARPAPAAQTPAASATRAAPAPSAETPGVHANFPRELHHSGSMAANDRVAAFQNVMVPLIQAENDRIRADRTRARSISRNPHAHGAERAWLDQKMEEYGANDLNDLLKRMDVIPVSLVLAQSALESGWGTDTIARTANAFFGQKAVRSQSDVQGPMGERYRSYDSPQHSIRSYMHNLNTHRAYAGFRDDRAQMRRQNKPLSGVDLASGLRSYSTRGSDYVSAVQKLIRSRDLARWDRG